MAKQEKHPKIGTWLTFAHLADARKADGHGDRRVDVVEYRLTRSVAGQMVGVTYLYSGTYHPGFGYDEWTPGYISDRKAILVYLVRLGLRSKPVRVLPSSARKLIKPPPQGLPWQAPAIPYEKTQGYQRVFQAVEVQPKVTQAVHP